MILETEAIILQVRRYSDTSKIAVVFSKEFGKISILAKGAFTAKSKFSGCLELLSYVNISFYKKSSSDLHLLKSVELVKPFYKITKNYDALIAGLVAAEMVNKTQNENFENIELFEYFVEFLQALNNDVEFGFSLCVNFLFCLAKNLGYLIDFSFVDGNSQNIREVKVFLDDVTNLADTHNYNNYNNYSSENYRKHFSFRFATVVKILDFDSENINKQIELSNNEFTELINFFATFFEFHLDKKIQIKTLNLL